MRPEARAEYHEYVAARTDAMRRFAYLSCGDWHRAEDAVQEAFVKLYKAWSRARRHSLDAYTRRIVVNALIDDHRKSWFRRERPRERLPETAYNDDDGTERMAIMDALSQLPVKRRTTLILRYWEDQSVEQTATIMNCSVHTVKSQTVRGLQTLRRLLTETVGEITEEAVS